MLDHLPACSYEGLDGTGQAFADKKFCLISHSLAHLLACMTVGLVSWDLGWIYPLQSMFE